MYTGKKKKKGLVLISLLTWLSCSPDDCISHETWSYRQPNNVSFLLLWSSWHEENRKRHTWMLTIIWTEQHRNGEIQKNLGKIDFSSWVSCSKHPKFIRMVLDIWTAFWVPTVQSGEVKLVLCGHWMHLCSMHEWRQRTTFTAPDYSRLRQNPNGASLHEKLYNQPPGTNVLNRREREGGGGGPHLSWQPKINRCNFG